MLSKKKAHKKETLNLTRNLSIIEYVFRISAYTKIIGPGSQTPFEYEMLSEVEEDLQFDMRRSCESFEFLYDKEEKKLKISFWRLLRASSRMWLLEEINNILFNLCKIGTGIFTKVFLDELEKDRVSSLFLLLLVGIMTGLGLFQTIFHTNYALFNGIMNRSNENNIKVKIIFFLYFNFLFDLIESFLICLLINFCRDCSFRRFRNCLHRI